jgi:hypothetical protein
MISSLAQFAFAPRHTDELTLAVGDVIVVLEVIFLCMF